MKFMLYTRKDGVEVVKVTGKGRLYYMSIFEFKTMFVNAATLYEQVTGTDVTYEIGPNAK